MFAINNKWMAGWALSQYKDCLSRYGVLMLKDCRETVLSLTWRSRYMVRRSLYIETAHCSASMLLRAMRWFGLICWLSNVVVNLNMCCCWKIDRQIYCKHNTQSSILIITANNSILNSDQPNSATTTLFNQYQHITFLSLKFGHDIKLRILSPWLKVPMGLGGIGWYHLIKQRLIKCVIRIWLPKQ